MSNVVQSAVNANTTGNPTVSCAFGSNITAGNAIIVFGWAEDPIIHSGAPNPPTISDTLANSYTLLHNADGGGTFESAIWVSMGVPAGANTITLGGANGFTRWGIAIAEIVNPIAINASGLSGTHNNTSPITVSLTATTPTAPLIMMITSNSATPTPTPGTWTLLLHTSFAATIDMWIYEAASVAAGARTQNITWVTAPLNESFALFMLGGSAPPRGNIDYDQIGTDARLGSGSKVAMSTGVFVSGHGVIVDSGTGSLKDSGFAPGNAVVFALQQEQYTYAADTGTANTYAIAISPAPTLAAGSIAVFKALNANTGASTLNVNSGGAVAITKNGPATALAAGDIVAGQIITVIYDGTEWQLTSGANAKQWVKEVPTGTLNGTNVTFTLSFTPVSGSLTLFLNIDQREGTDFTISTNTITFTTAPKASDTNWFYARYQH